MAHSIHNKWTPFIQLLAYVCLLRPIQTVHDAVHFCNTYVCMILHCTLQYRTTLRTCAYPQSMCRCLRMSLSQIHVIYGGGVHTDYCGQLWQKDMFDFRGLQFAEIYGAMCNVNITVLFMCLISPDKHSTVCSL